MHQFNAKRLEQVAWIKNSIIINTRDKLKRKTIITNLKSDWLNFKRTRNKVNIGQYRWK